MMLKFARLPDHYLKGCAAHFIAASNAAHRSRFVLWESSRALQDDSDRSVETGISLITVTESSHSGASIETVESIKKYGTRIYASRNRAVTSSDYEALIPSIYPETESVSAYGGETLSPPRFGKVYISIKPYNDRYLSNLIKDNIRRFDVIQGEKFLKECLSSI